MLGLFPFLLAAERRVFGANAGLDRQQAFIGRQVVNFAKRRKHLAEFKGAGEVKRSHFFEFISCAATQQLFNVSTSIDSRVIGDSL